MNQPPLHINQWHQLEAVPPHQCPYLSDRQAQLSLGLIVPDAATFDDLMATGHRRQGLVFYRPACGSCQSCLPIRIPLDAFQPSKSQRRLLRRFGPRYVAEVRAPFYSREHFDLYVGHAHHVAARNDPDDPDRYRRAFVDTLVNTRIVEYRIDGQLVCVSILDEGEQTVSSMYAFWDPAFARYSPGTFSALWEIEWSKENGKRYYHLGYWVRDCSRMSYKNRFRPYELYDWDSKTWSRHETTEQL